MKSVSELKQSTITETPLLLFECKRGSGATDRWSTHSVTVEGNRYSARVLRHNLLEFRGGSDLAIEAAAKLTLTLANADSYFSQVMRGEGWKGAKLVVSFTFWDAREAAAASETIVVFKGVCNPPDEVTEGTIRLTFTSRMNMQRVLLPQVRIQRRCPWMFPANEQQRSEAAAGGARGTYSPFHLCGYSPADAGNTNNGEFFTSCDHTRAQCIERGMFDKDDQGRTTRRFGGIGFVPSTISVKTYGDRGTHLSAATDNESKYNDFVPLVYGTAWHRPPVVFARSDGNLTRMEVLLGLGEIEAVLKVIANGVELPSGSSAKNATATGWYNVVTHGSRSGAFNLDFLNADGTPAGDPYGSMAVLSVVIPNRLHEGKGLPRVEVLIQGLRCPVFDENGAELGLQFTNNPAWVLLDILRRSGWELDEIDVASFARSAVYCDERIESTDLHGATVQIPRFQCNLALRQRRSAADIIRGVRNGSGLSLTYGVGGLLSLQPESSLAVQHPTKVASSNSLEPLGGGWPAYEFGDSSSSFSDILRRQGGAPSVRLWCRSSAESANRYSVEFQDEFNEFQQDSLSLVDVEDSITSGAEVSAPLLALGIPNFNQAARVTRLALDKSLRGNTYIEFETGLRAIGLKPGDLITVSYAKEGLARQAFRIVRIVPGQNFETAIVTAQWHDDTWYIGRQGTDGLAGGGRLPMPQLGVPRPLVGTVMTNGTSDFGVEEMYHERTDGSWDLTLSVTYQVPDKPPIGAPSRPVLSLSCDVESSGGNLKGGRDYYYAVSSVNAAGQESSLSFIVRAAVSPATDTNTVLLKQISCSPDAVKLRIYRGENPSELGRIATLDAVSSTFRDHGQSLVDGVAPDEHFDHANFYWRLEVSPERPVTGHSQLSVSAAEAGFLKDEFRGKSVRVVSGKGRGQERTVGSNTTDTVSVTEKWELEPDETSTFAICEPAWTPAATGNQSPVTFSVPNRQGSVVQILGLAANVQNRECAIALSPVTRHVAGGAALDEDVPDAPLFGVSTSGRGTLDIGGIGFTTPANTRGIIAGSLTIHYWNELDGETAVRAVQAVNAGSDSLTLTSVDDIVEGAVLQIGQELVKVSSVAGTTVDVERGAFGTQAGQHQGA
ncbi:MAG TPA: phage tail protein, partial [Bryobacteraceae bacterium]|nr:phage tail protein [Bryobacteraceae bacterium]